MSLREKFVKNELEKIYQILNNSYEFCPHSMLQDDRRFLRKYLNYFFKINDKANILRQVVKGNYLIL